MMTRTKRPTPPKPAPMTQERQRKRRRGWLPVTYGGDFDLAAEVLAICGPLANRAAAAPNPQRYAGEIDAVVTAVHELVHVVVGLNVERDARVRTAHLGPDKRPRAIQKLNDLAVRPPLPEVGVDQISTGAWAAVLTELARPYAAPLAEYLAVATAPGSSALRGQPSVSERLETALRAVDGEVSILRRRLDRAPAPRRMPTPPPSAADAARAELQALGVDL